MAPGIIKELCSECAISNSMQVVPSRHELFFRALVLEFFLNISLTLRKDRFYFNLARLTDAMMISNLYLLTGCHIQLNCG